MECASPIPVRINSSLILCEVLVDDLDYMCDIDESPLHLQSIAQNVAVFAISEDFYTPFQMYTPDDFTTNTIGYIEFYDIIASLLND